MKNFKRNEFLTDIARKYNSQISEVDICDLAPQKKMRGTVFKYHDKYLILIDRKHNLCAIHSIWVTLHEIAHVVKKHTDNYSKMSFIDRLISEREADLWAATEFGMLKDDGSVEVDSIYCLPCCQYGATICNKVLKVEI